MEKYRNFTAMDRKHVTALTGRVLLLLIVAGTWHCKDRKPQAGSGQLIYKNETQQAMTITLPDQTTVVLRPRTILEISKSFNINDRDVKLDGQAVFTAGSGGNHDLIVHTRNLHILVVKGQFHVDAFASNAGEEVDLLSGKLKVTKSYHSTTDNAEEILEGGDMVMINRDIDLMEKEKLNPTELEALEKKISDR